MADPRARIAKIRDGLTPREWARAGAMVAANVGLNVLGWGLLAAATGGHYHINTAGFVIVGVFVLTWVVALSIWRFGKIEQKWDTAGATAPE